VDSFIRLLLAGFLCLILASVVMLMLKFTTDFHYEWQIAAITMMIFCLLNPLLMKKNESVKRFVQHSLIVVLALFIDLIILSALVAWQSPSEAWQNMKILVIATTFFPISWFIKLLFRQ